MRSSIVYTFFLTAKLLVAQDKNPFEAIRLQTNHELYLTGENVFLTLTCDMDGIPSPVSKIVYIELLNQEKEPKIQLLGDLCDGRFTGSFFLPSTLTTGNYALIAYTNWMKNEPPSFFTKCITVVNPFESIPAHVFSDSSHIRNSSSPEERYDKSFTTISDKVLASDSVHFSIVSERVDSQPLVLSIKRRDERSSYRAPKIDIEGSVYFEAESNHLPELHGHILAGTTQDESGSPLEASVSLTSSSYHHPPIFTKSTRQGNFNFVISKEQREGKILIHSTPKARIRINSPFFQTYGHLSIPELSIPAGLKDWLLRRAQQIQIEDNYFSVKYAMVDKEKQGGALDFIESISYLLDDYKRFSLIEDPIIEYIPEVSFKVQKGSKRITIPEYLVTGNSDSTLVLLNGIPVPFKTIFEQNLSYIEKITVYPTNIAINDSEFRGIVHFEAFERFASKIDVGVYTLDYAGPQYEFSKTSDSRVPDYRDQLLWKALDSNSFTAQRKFKTSLIKGEYEVVVMNLDGQVIGRALFFVN